MQYLGGKSRIAKPISEVILAERGDRTTYIEPFLGAGSVALQLAPHFEDMLLSDVVLDLVMLWQAVIDGWVPPESLSEEEYRELRHAEPSALRAFAGFACSFGGKWFAGYARGSHDYAAGGSRSLAKRGAALSHADVLRLDYRDHDDWIGPDTVVYLDPPYAGTTSYGAAGDFDSDEFWWYVREWTGRGAAVFVSEYSAPGDFVPVWAREVTASLVGGAKQSGRTARESLFVHYPELA